MDVKEGFLCPMCLQDLRSFHNLQNHFDAHHSSEDKAVATQIRGLFSKAKDKILGKEYERNDPRNPFSALSSSTDNGRLLHAEFDPSFWDPQELGVTKNHMDKFKLMRDARIDRVVIETNKIVIRLDKLLRLSETNPSKRKSFEQNLVPWVEDENVPYCPTCGDRFTVTKRRHHCRLCGAVMCARCSIFLPFPVASDLVKSVYSSGKSSPARRSARAKQNLPTREAERDKLVIRICYECYKVLQRNKEKLDRHRNPTLLVLLYEKMQKAINEAVKHSPEFETMAESLNAGKDEFKLDAANQKRFLLLQMFEAIDVISKKIAALNAGDEENPPLPGELRLQATIRRAAYTFLQENMLSLPSLPSQPKLQVLQAQRKAENERRLRKQREQAKRQREEDKRRQEIERLRRERDLMEEQNKTEQVSFSRANSVDRPSVLIVKDSGWSADTISITSNTSRQSKLRGFAFDDDDDEDEHSNLTSSPPVKEDPLEPLLEQIQYVHESAKQARAAGMDSEADCLEKNAEELEKEYKKQRTAMAFAVTPTTPTRTDFFQTEGPGLSSGESFKPSTNTDDTGEHPLLLQIRYVSKSIEEARTAEKYDEMIILEDNLEELKKLYNGLACR